MNPIIHMNLTQMQSAVLKREITASEIVQAHIDRIHAVEHKVGAFISLREEAAIKRAMLLDAQGGGNALAGIPAAVKDNICIRDGRTTCASRMLEHFVSPYSATAWEKLDQAGSILLGKTNLDEFGMGSTTEHSAFHPTCNPHDLTRVPGGSSGGSAAAVAAGMVAFALGSDTGGSVRQPASHCGVVGMKPTYGTVSRYGLTAFASSMEQIGPITRNVRDNALIMEHIAGRDSRDGTSVAHPGGFSRMIGQDVKGLRIGLPKEMFAEGLSAEVRDAVLHAAHVLENLGAVVHEVSLPHVTYALPAYDIISSAEASSNLARFDGVRYGRRAENYADLEELYIRSRSEGLGDEVKRRILLGTYVLSEGYYDAYYHRALQARTLVKQEFDLVFEKVDCLLSPVAPETAPAFGEIQDPLSAFLGDIYTVPANVAGIPALSLPCSMDANGLPIGMQLMGPAFSEPVLYCIGHEVEEALGPVVKEVNL